MSKNEENNRIYINSSFSGLQLGFIEVREATAEFTQKKQLMTKNKNTFLSFHKANDEYFLNEVDDSTHSHLSKKVDSSGGSLSSPSLTRYNYYHKALCAYFYTNVYPGFFTRPRYYIQDIVKTLSTRNGSYWYFPTVEAGLNTYYNASVEYTVKIYYYTANASSIGTALDLTCVGRQYYEFSTSAFMFEFGEGEGKFISFSSMHRNVRYHDSCAYITYKIYTCSGTSCSHGGDRKLIGDTPYCGESESHCRNYYSNSSCNTSSCAHFTQDNCHNQDETRLVSVKKDTDNPYVFYVRTFYNNFYYNRQWIFNSSGTSAQARDKTDSYGFTAHIGNTTNPDTNQTYNLFLGSYFDRSTNRFRIGMKALPDFEFSDSGKYLAFGEGTYDNYHGDQYKVTHNDGTTLGFPNDFFSHPTGEEFNLNSPRSLRVSAGLANKVLKDEARCNDEEDYLLIGDYYYYCVSSCSDYFGGLVLETSGLTHSCDNKIAFTDFEKTRHRCVAGFVDDASNCPDLMFDGAENYKFRYAHTGYVERRYDCRGEYILKPTGDTIATSVSETGTCGTCDYTTKKVVETSTHFYYDAANVQTTQKRKYCLDACDISPFLIIYQAVEEGVTKSYCTETCIAANSITDVSPDQPFYDPTDTVNQCKYHCPSGANYVTSAANTANIAAILVKPICNTACPDTTNYRVHQADFTDAVGNTVPYKYCLNTCTTDAKLFTREHTTHRECVTACPANEGFYYYLSSADPQYCVSVCPSSHPYITGHHTHTGLPTDITTGHCKTACDSNTHYKYEMTTGVYLCLEQCYPNPNVVDNSCSTATCQPYRSFFLSDRICIKDCPTGNKHLQTFSGVLDIVTHESSRGYCRNSCPTNHFKYTNRDSTCITCPGSCTETVAATRIDSILAGTTTEADLNNGCTRVHCLASECHSDKPFFSSERICITDCPVGRKHLKPFTDIIDTIEHNSLKGFCEASCGTYDFKYMNPTTTCTSCISDCTEAAIATRIDSILAGTTTIADLNNGCTRVHCLPSECHSDKPFFTSQRICAADCPPRRKHLRPFTDIIDTIEHNSTKGLCEADCGLNDFKYMNPTTTCTNCLSDCTEAAIAARLDSILAGTTTVADLNNGCTRVHCLASECHPDKPYFTSEKICAADCPPRRKYLRPFTDIITTIEHNSLKGLCGTSCGLNEFKYMNPTTTCTNCPGSCDEAAIATRIDSILAGTTTEADLNNGCTRVHCLPSECHSDKPYFTSEKICAADCPPRRKHLKPFTDIIDTIEHNSTKGLCEADCGLNDFKYMNPTTTCTNCLSDCTEAAIAARLDSILAGTTTVADLNNGCTRVHCLASECHPDKPFFTPERICVTDCPSRRKHLRPFTGIISTIEHDSAKGLCDTDCDSTHFKYVNPTTTCANCPPSCNEAAIAASFAQVEAGSQPASFLNNLCARVHCMNECHSDKPFFTPNRLCYTLCPNSHPYVRKFTGVINKMEFNSTKGQCNTACAASEFIYFNISTQHQNHCLDRCYEDKPYWDTAKICLAICPSHVPLVNPENPGSAFSVSMGEGVCKSACQAGFNFRYNIPDNTHQYFCLTQCKIPKKYFVRYSTHNECVYECPFHLRYVHPTTNECLLSCPSSHPYYNSQGICLEKCDDYIYEWECAPSCKPGYNYVVQQSCSALCSKEIVGWNCLPYCPLNYSNQLNNYCAISCLKNQFLDEVVNFKEPTEFGVCKGGCSGYLIEGGVFSSGITKVYCVPACPDLYMKEIRSPTERWCREECKIESPWKFTVQGDSCVSDCIALGYKYISEDYACIDECSFFIDNEIWCVSKCPNERPFVYEQHCVEECPKNSRFVNDFTFCVPECESFNYNIFCVDRCDSAELATYYNERQLNFRVLPFVHSNLNCAEACDEPGFEWINETNNQCVASCPMPCEDGVCSQPEMKYKEPTKYCRKECSQKEYSFTDNKSEECLAECKAERRFFVEEDKLCLSSCPKEKPLIFEKAVCEDRGLCDTECKQIHFVCVAACPKEAIYTLKKKDEEYCLCVCPQFYRPKPGTPVCELFCDEEKGLLPNSTEDSCNACRDDGLFLWQGECIRECPTGTLSNPFNSCRTCKQLNLWMDHTFKCVKFTDCSELSLFDYVNHICTRCDGEGMMVRKVFPGDFVCLKTECIDGHIIEGIINKCFVCPTGWFFSGETCFKTCPDKLFNDYNRFICTNNCFESCSDDCCVNGSCKIIQGKSECTCEEGFYGEKCDVTKEDLPKVVATIQAILVKKLKKGLFTRADTNALIEFYFYAKALLSARRQLIRVDPTLTANLRTFINESRIEFAFQPTILGLVDSLILIEKLSFSQTGQSTGFDSAISLLDTMTDDIQIFLTQNSEVGEFERIFEGKYTGQAFIFQFGTDIQQVTEVNVSKCIERIIEKESLTFGVKFPFKLLKFSSEVESSVTRTFPHAFNLSSTGKFELTIYKETGLYPLNEICLENYVDTTEQVTMEPEKKETSQKFANIGVNVFDITVPFFNDKCVPYQSEDGKDLTLAERKAKLYKDPSELCAESAAKVCSVEGFSPEGEAICVCRGIQNRKKSSLQSIASTYPQTNYILITCYDTFRQSNIFRNVGFYVVFLSFVTFSSVGIRSIFHSDSEIHSSKRFAFIRNDVTFYEPESMEIEIYFEWCYTLKEKLSIYMIEISDKGDLIRALDEEEKKAMFKVLPTVCDLKYLSFEQLLEFDRRSHFQFAIDTLIERNSLFNTFYLDSLTFPKYFRIMFFVTEFNLNIALNAFFIDDSLVESFNEQEETGFFYSLTNESTKTMWAFLTTKIIMIIFKFLYRVGKRNHDNLLRRMKSIEADYLKRAFNHFLLNMRFASLAFSFVAILFNLFCAYFVVVFCEIYKNSIDIWINGIYMGWIFDYLVLGGFVPLLLSGSRYLATKNSNLSFFYKLSNVVDVMLSLGLNN